MSPVMNDTTMQKVAREDELLKKAALSTDTNNNHVKFSRNWKSSQWSLLAFSLVLLFGIYFSFLRPSRTPSTATLQSSGYLNCHSTAFPHPKLFGAEIKSLAAVERKLKVEEAAQGKLVIGQDASDLHFCNVNITYTHPGTNDCINVQIWLPVNGWNMRFQGTGGGGFATGLFDYALAPAISKGFAAASTDGGHAFDFESPNWALVSPGNVNQYLLLDYASLALHDMTVLGKAVTQSYYGMAPKYSYWTGCSTGGRQGLMMAQNYPGAYDGILAAAPAINMPSFVPAEHWGQLVMNQLGVYPLQCEFEDFVLRAVKACDSLDGLVDGIIAAPGLCKFDPHSIVGEDFDCGGETMTHSSEAATIVEKVWEGPRKPDGSFLWYGLNPDASFSKLIKTACDANGTCHGQPFEITSDWIRYFVKKDPNFSITAITMQEYFTIFRLSQQNYGSLLGTNDPDLSEFRDRGGKMITWHGLVDELIFPNGTAQYYDRVLAGDPEAHNYYRYFEAPGVAHCWGGTGPYPSSALESLIQWVEQGVAPDSLEGTSPPNPNDGIIRHQPLCPYPLVSAYQSGDPTLASSFRCAAAFSRQGGV